MTDELTDIEVRVLGSLIEKELTTPEYYPLTLNALTNACNQKSNRNPEVSFEEATVVRGLDGLRERGLANVVHKADSRVPKYQHFFGEKLNLSQKEVVILCELMLRGPQTLGEVRSHTERMYSFNGLESVEEVLRQLMEREDPLAIKLPRMTGQKEQRYAHLLTGVPGTVESDQQIKPEKATIQVRAENERIAELERTVGELRAELDELKKTLLEFKSQF